MPFGYRHTSKYFKLPRNKFKVILTDPPWKFKSYDGKTSVPNRRKSGDPYPTMTREELLAMPVEEIAHKDCALFMWVIDSHLDQAFELLNKWGFKYKTIAFVWVKVTKAGKPHMGMGHWTRKCSEICLMATRGKPKRMNAGVYQVLLQRKRENSRKPDDFYLFIQRLVKGPYLEMFSRTTFNKKWTVWGKDVDMFTAKKPKKTRISG